MIDVHDDLVAALAGRYEIEREIGHGGMATVYLARDVRHDRHVALKVLRADLTSTLGAERFVREINIAARLSHPHILALYDSGSAANTLYYVMPHVAGETLRQRLDREHQLPLDEALAITRQIASALDYAHAQGVVHRDIKPENILLLDDHVLVADFGLARALYSAASTRLTGSAVAVGTPAYMSPEQAAADPQVDGRTDLYSLACVLFEMVTGSPPFHGATVQALMMHHLNSPPPSMCAQRTACPPWVDEAVQRALAKMPADRFRTAAQFVRALDGQAPGATPVVGRTPVMTAVVTRRRVWQRRGIGAAAALGVLASAMFFGWWTTRARTEPAPLQDSRFYMAPPLLRGVADSIAMDVDESVRTAMAEWTGLTLIDGDDSDTTARRAVTTPGIGDLLDLAKAARARWLVRTEVSVSGDSATVRATLYDAASGSEVRTDFIQHAVHGTAPRMRYRELANMLVRGSKELPWKSADDRGPASLPAWRAYDRARTALRSWDDSVAERELVTAIALEPELAEAHLWLAQLRMWLAEPVGEWRGAARRAYDLRGRLDSVDVLLARGNWYLAEARYPDACTAYGDAIRRDSTDFRGWLGLGDCQARDSAVVRDPRSPSGFRFRTSIHAATRAYLGAADRIAAPRPAFLYRRLARVLFIAPNRYRAGVEAGAEGRTFGAYPSLEADTLASIPYPLTLLIDARAAMSPRTRMGALDRNRRILRSLYMDWIRESPRSVEAHTMLGELLETTEAITPATDGAPSALEEFDRARSLLPPSLERLSLDRSRIRLLVKNGEWARAALLSDSLLSSWPNPEGAAAGALVGPAALTGRVGLTSRLLAAMPLSDPVEFTLPSGRTLDLSPAIQRDASEMFAYAALGVCTDTLRAFPERVERRLRSYYANSEERAVITSAILRGHLMKGAGCFGTASMLGISNPDPWIRMGQAVARGRKDRVHAELASLAEARRHNRPGDVAIDFTFYEAWMLAAVGDTVGAAAHLDHSLNALPTLGKSLLDMPAQSAGLVRAMGLRAELAARTGDRATARRWAGAVVDLWSGADKELKPYVAEMRRILDAK